MPSKHLPLLAIAAVFIAGDAVADTYQSASNRFAVDYIAPWKAIALPDPTGELFLLCEEKECGPRVLLSFGAFLEPALKSGKLTDFLANAKGETILQNVRSARGVVKVSLLREGRARVGSTDAYEVLAEITLQSGQKRLRHTFMTFDSGYIYNVSLGCAPELHANALVKARAVLATFRLK
jgi:hypothetical protein